MRAVGDHHAEIFGRAQVAPWVPSAQSKGMRRGPPTVSLRSDGGRPDGSNFEAIYDYCWSADGHLAVWASHGPTNVPRRTRQQLQDDDALTAISILLGDVDAAKPENEANALSALIPLGLPGDRASLLLKSAQARRRCCR